MLVRFALGPVIVSALATIGCSSASSTRGGAEAGGVNAPGGVSPIGGSATTAGTSFQGGSGSGAETTGSLALATGGTTSSSQNSVGGSQPIGGAQSMGGTAVAGGSRAFGGVQSTGGLVSTGGTTGNTTMAGSSSTGGSKQVGSSRISTSLGGAAIGGSAPNSGGAATGGSAATGGATFAGGTASTGGSLSSGGAGDNVLIHNDEFWKDTTGTPIYSQGGGVLRVGTTYYWYGVKYNGAVTYAAKPTSSNSDTAFVAVTIYSSTDLTTWKFENNALTAASLTAAGADPTNWIGRVGAAYNATTKKYVLNGQYKGTPDTTQFFATSDTPNGAFTWKSTQATITNVTNNNCGDQSIFNDDDGQAYLICSSQNGRSNLYVAPLHSADYLSVDAATRVFGGAGREGNAMFKYDGHYYLCSSDLHGWNASHSYYITATNILGPYGTEGIIGNTDADFSHVTQTGLFITVPGTTQRTVIFGGDRWSDFAGNGSGYNQWMPLTFSGNVPTMQSLSEWSINAEAGTWSVGPGNNYALNPSFEADRVSMTQPAGWSSTNGTNVAGGHSGHWSWQLTGSSSLGQTVMDLTNGSYTLSAWVKSSAAGGQLYAKSFGGTDKVTAISSGTAWSNATLSNIAVTNGQCDVGITGTGQTITVDDFALIKN